MQLRKSVEKHDTIREHDAVRERHAHEGKFHDLSAVCDHYSQLASIVLRSIYVLHGRVLIPN